MKQKVLFFFIAILGCITGFSQTPSANFTSDITSGCAPIVVNFQDQSIGSPTGWQWDFGNGSTSTRQNPSTTYITPGTYTVTLTVTNANGSHTTTKTNYITVYNEPVAAFITDKRSGCSPAVIKFTDQSTTPQGTVINAWKWDFGDGNSSTQQNPQHVYRTVGSYTVTLTVTSDKGCKKLITKPNYIDVTSGINASFGYTDPGVCSAPATVQFNNTSSGPGTITYSWSFGNGNNATVNNPSTTYTTNGLYHVVLLVASNQGCQDTAVKDIQVGLVNTNFTFPASICPKTPVSFTNASTPRPIRSFWQFSTGFTDTLRNTTTSFPAAGTYTVTLINMYAVCTDTLKKTVTVQPGPIFSFNTTDTAKCQPSLTANFSSSGSISSYFWDFGDSTTSTQSNPSHTYTSFGSFSVSLIGTAANGCRDTVRKMAYIKIQKPVISFPGFPSGGCLPYTTTFTPSIQSLDSVMSYSWNFGDGGTSLVRNPVHTYADSGTYNVSLTITTRTGCTETFTLNQAVKVGQKPIAQFTSDVTTACADPGIQFINQSTGATQWLWEFSDGSTSTQRDPRQTFKDTGWIDVKLYAINNGCSTLVTKTHYAYIRPSVSNFTYQPDCNNPLVYRFTDKSILPTSWTWDFGDGTTYNGQSPPSHTFPSRGSYQVKLTTSNGNCSSTLIRTVTIIDNTPRFSAVEREGCKPFRTTLVASAPVPAAIRKYYWSYGDGSPIDSVQGSTAVHTFLQAGNFPITLTTLDSFGCKQTFTQNPYIRVNGPIAGFSSLNNNGCKGMIVTFADSTKTDGINPVVQWQWNFGDGSVVSFTNPPFQHLYDTINDFDVSLVVTDAKGCKDSILKRSFVKVSTLKAKFATDVSSCPGVPVGFYNQSQSDLPFSSLWSFGDGQTSTFQNPGHPYADTGYFSVNLVVRDIVGCQDSLQIDSAVHIARPVASFTANNFTSYCTPFQAIFTNTSYFVGTNYWDLGSGQGSSTQQNPTAYYSNTGTYPIKLVVTGPGGCKDSVTHPLQIYNPQDARLTYSPLSGCTPLMVSFNAFTPMNGRFIWDFGDGTVTDTTINAIEHLYVDYGDVTPLVILKEPSGTCTIPLVGVQPIALLGAKLNFAIDSLNFCDNGLIHISDSTTTNDPNLQYTWNFGDGNTSALQNPTHQYDSIGTFDVTLYIRTQRGCLDTLVKGPVKISQSPIIDIQADSIICLNDKVSYDGLIIRTDTSAALRWKWTFPNGASSTLQNPGLQTYTMAGSYTVTAVATNSSGCSYTDSASLLINPLPVVTMPPTITKLVGVPVTLSPTYSSNVTTYNWTPATELSCTTCPQPIATPKFTTLYRVNVVDSNSCTNTGTVQIIVICKGATVFVPNTFSPNGDGSNDVLYVRGVGLDRVKSLRIFNRWGEVVFEQRNFPVNNPSNGWNGTYKGSKAQSDVYIYQVEVFCENSEIIRFEGNITLIR
ncbi:MAG: hypothetical protein JWP88_8 [Flaviaesturariibacter sp.]|nr:hypothetical protein [Flaviaesturariibacter sp.]